MIISTESAKPAIERSTPAQPKHYPGLDGVRGLAILGVLCVHSYSMVTAVLPQTFWPYLSNTFEFGIFGVDLFFVLSGFLITGILLRTKAKPDFFQTFYARRIFRLAPLYYGYLALVAFAVPGFHRLTHSTMGDYHGPWWWYLVYLSNWKPDHGVPDAFLGHFWSLAVEEQFYCVWPFLVYLLSRRNLALVCGALIALAISVRVWMTYQLVDWEVMWRSTPARVDSLAFGALLALALSSSRWRETWLRWSGWIGGIAFAAFLGLRLWAQSDPVQSLEAQVAVPVLAALAFVSLVTYSVTQRSRVLEFGPLRWAGKYSYAAYVLHALILAYAMNLEATLCRNIHNATGRVFIGLISFLGFQAVVFAVARASWHFFEGPIQHWKDRIFKPSGVVA